MRIGANGCRSGANVPYFKQYRNSDNKLVRSKQHFHISPEKLSINGHVSPEERYRSIYEAVVYSSELKIKGLCLLPDVSDFPQDNVTMLWEEAYLSVGLSDIRGLKDDVVINWSGTKKVFEAGLPDTDLFASGLHVKLPLDGDSLTSRHSFNLDLRFNGSSNMRFTPIGKSTTVHLSSQWPNPSFDGAYIPDTNSVSEKGFDARWKVLHLNRNYRQWWSNTIHSVRESAFGVLCCFRLMCIKSLFDHRSMPFCLSALFIGVTFLLFFFMEILNKKMVHPIQYTLAGIALVVFYGLLISLSEHISFDLAYLVASLAVILQISLNSLSILKQKKLSGIIASVLGLLYFYILLQLQGYALLMGSVGLFMLVAFTMYLSRNVNWHQLVQKKTDDVCKEIELDS